MAFLAGGAEGNERVVVLGGQVLSGEGWTVGWPLAMTDDAAVVAYQLTHPETGKGCIAVNGRRGEEFDAVGTPVMSADGRTVAYRAQKDGAAFVVVGGRHGPEFEFVKDPALSADGKSVAYALARGGRWFLLAGDREIALDHEPIDVFIGPDSRFVGHSYLKVREDGGSEARVVVGDRKGGLFDLVGRAVFSPDGRTVAYAGERASRQYMVIADRVIEVAGRVSDPVFSPDGRKVGYGARIGREIWWKVLALP